MSKFSINGKTINVISGNNISVINNQVWVDGKLTNVNSESENILKIEIIGDLASITCDSSVTVHGNIFGEVKAKGSVNCDNIQGNVQASGSVNCDDITGTVSAGGSINADKIVNK